ncbi:hypothetical protein F4861DRAFT_28272 [Xylaria intraflava]|nr:hypothetical protein F4861DRAFT_28272 [Xylaria intraflava]
MDVIHPTNQPPNQPKQLSPSPRCGGAWLSPRFRYYDTYNIWGYFPNVAREGRPSRNEVIEPRGCEPPEAIFYWLVFIWEVASRYILGPFPSRPVRPSNGSSPLRMDNPFKKNPLVYSLHRRTLRSRYTKIESQIVCVVVVEVVVLVVVSRGKRKTTNQ